MTSPPATFAATASRSEGERPSTAEESYDAELFEEMARVDEGHFWFKTRNEVIEAAICTIAVEQPRILEIGCGNGNVLRRIDSPPRRVVGLDLYGEGLAVARKRISTTLVQGDAGRPPFWPVFDIVGLFDVLEHLQDDLGAMHAALSTLKPGGHIVVTVPAHQSLWSYADEVAHHVRRYQEEELCARLDKAGFEVEFSTPFMSALLPLAWAVRRGQSLARHKNSEKMSAELAPPALMNRALAKVLAFEPKRVSQRRRIAFGMSIIAIARRR